MRFSLPRYLTRAGWPALLGISLILTPGRVAAAEGDAIYLKDVPAVKQIQRDQMNEGEHRIREVREARERQKRAALRAKKLGKKGGQRVRPVSLPREGAAFDESPVRRASRTENLPPMITPFSIPTNVRMNNPAGDGAASAQSEVSMAIVGQYGVSSWNDGEGFITPPNGQGVAYTTDGGATWTDVGLPPLGSGITDWASDPVVAVNEKTGEFWFCALVDVGSDAGIGVIRATFPAGVFTWDTPRLVQSLPTASHFLDKQWMVADSSNGNLYLSFTHFIVGGSSIGFQRSVDGGVTWGPELTVSTSSGDIQGSRPAVAGDGTLYVIWRQVGTIDVDFIRTRRSIDQGVSFQPVNASISYFDNYGTGSPGFNRNRNVVEPCPVVDRSNGPHRGRLYVVVHESLNWFDDPVGGGTFKNEPVLSLNNEVPNNFFSRAVPFTAGQNLRGGMRPAGDLDYWSFPATQGTSYIFWTDSLSQTSGGALYTMRVFCGADTLTRLAYSGDVDAPGGGQSLYMWTAPTTATYYLRIAHSSGGLATSNGYRVRTGIAAHGAEVGRDQRDVVLHYSDDGAATWSAPKRVNDDAGFYDNFLPEVGVTTEGFPYCAWYDFRDASTSCYGQSQLYVSRSLDGGDTWEANKPVTSAPTAWTTAATNIQPNQGDYIALYAGDKLALGWGDARAGEADVNSWGTAIDPSFQLACVSDATLDNNGTRNIEIGITNNNVVFGNTYTVSVTNDRDWSMTFPATHALAEGATGAVPVTITVPDSGGSVNVCYTISLGGAIVKQCCTNFLVGQVGVGDVASADFAIHGLSPNPATRDLSVSFSLPRSGPARLELLDVNGRRVASRDAGNLGAGRHSLRFDREIAAVPAGVYAVKLVQNGRAVTSKVSVVR